MKTVHNIQDTVPQTLEITDLWLGDQVWGDADIVLLRSLMVDFIINNTISMILKL